MMDKRDELENLRAGVEYHRMMAASLRGVDDEESARYARLPIALELRSTVDDATRKAWATAEDWGYPACEPILHGILEMLRDLVATTEDRMSGGES